MPRAEDDFELVLRRCNERLSEITLTVPALDGTGARRSPSVSLDTLTLDSPTDFKPLAPSLKPPIPLPARAPMPRLEPPEPPPAPAPAPAPAAVPPKAVEVTAAKAPAAPPPPVTEEHEIFPPPSFAQRPPRAPAPVRQTAPAQAVPVAGTKTLVAAAAFLVAAGFGAYRYSRSADAALRIALERPVDGMAIRTEKGDILVAEGAELLTLARDGSTTGREPLEAPVAALDWDQGSTWSLDGRTAALIERREGLKPTRYELNHVPTALFVKDRYLWTADRAAHSIHQYLVSRSILGAILQPLDRIDLPGMDIETFAFDAAGDLWVVDAGRRSLVRLKSVGGVYKAVATAPLSPLLGPTGEMRGLFLEEDGLWLANNAAGAAVLRRIPASSLDWAPAE